jgi:ATP-dependent RNA helicase RhlE
LSALQKEGYTTPTPIQQQTIPEALLGNDILGVAQTGTGKTAAFAIPIIQRLALDKNLRPGRKPIRSLVLTPTRELAIQIHESFTTYGGTLNQRYAVIFGGVNQTSQVKTLQQGVDVLIATPGRLLDLINQRYIDLSHLQIFVLDEADRMLDMGFVHDVKKVIAKLPHHRQSLFFSATMPPEIVSLASTILHNPVSVEVTPVSSTADTVNQVVYFVDKNNKRRLLPHLMRQEKIDRALVFTRTKHGADKVARELAKSGISAAAIHGNKSQNARQNALNNFKSSKISILVATDIAARGIDIDNLTHVFNYDLPNIPESYVHRIGRTGRAGASGQAIAFCDEEEKPFLKEIQKLIGKVIPVAEPVGFSFQQAEENKQIQSSASQATAQNRQPKQASRPKPSDENGQKRRRHWHKR